MDQRTRKVDSFLAWNVEGAERGKKQKVGKRWHIGGEVKSINKMVQ